MGKTTDNKYFYEVVKTKHVWLLSNTYQIQRCVEKDTHVCKKPNRCVFFQTGGATFCICTCIWVFDIWYNALYLFITIISEAHMQYQTSRTPSKQPLKNHLFGNSHTCVEKPTHIKNKNSKNNIKTNIFFLFVHPLNSRIPCKDSKNNFVSSFHWAVQKVAA